MQGSGQVILLDTNIIIESVRTGAWNGLRGHYSVVTVEKCREEAQSGMSRSPGYVVVTDEHLGQGLEIVGVSDAERAALAIRCPDTAVLDDGERELWAHAHSRTDQWRAACADQAAVRVATEMEWGDRLVSLEALVTSAGIRLNEKLKAHYTTSTLTKWRTNFKLGL